MASSRTPNALPVDADGNTMQIESAHVFQDNTGTPQKSPLAITSGGGVVTIVVPETAVTVTFTPDGSDIIVGGDATLALGKTIAKDGTSRTFGVTNMANIYVEDSTAVCTLYFDFGVAD